MNLLVINCAIVGAMLVGVALRKRRSLHGRWMVGCFLADTLLLLWVQFRSDAIQEASQRMLEEGSTPEALARWTAIHVSFAVVGLVAWIPTLALGRRVLRGAAHLRRRHRVSAIVLLLARIGNAATAFLVVA